jgi:hypothetical protein
MHPALRTIYYSQSSGGAETLQWDDGTDMLWDGTDPSLWDAALVGVWLLADGFWNDAGIWNDAATWID